jgi:hypothetical protein
MAKKLKLEQKQAVGELVWNSMKRTGAAKRPLAKGESLHDRIDADLLEIQREFSSRLLVLLKMQ